MRTSLFLPNSTYKKAQQGLTLIELLVVMAIIGIFSGVTLSSIGLFRDSPGKAIFKKLEGIFNLSRDEAILTGKTHGIFIDQGSVYVMAYGGTINEPEKLAESISKFVEDAASEEDADLGEFPASRERSWQKIDVESVELGDKADISFTSTKQKKGFNSVADWLKTVQKQTGEGSEEKDTDTTKKQAAEQLEPSIVFLPNGIIVPAGELVLNEGEDIYMLKWEQGGEVKSVYP